MRGTDFLSAAIVGLAALSGGDCKFVAESLSWPFATITLVDPSGRKIMYVDGTTVTVTLSFAVADWACDEIGKHANSTGMSINHHHERYRALWSAADMNAFALRAIQIIVSRKLSANRTFTTIRKTTKKTRGEVRVGGVAPSCQRHRWGRTATNCSSRGKTVPLWPLS